MKQQMKTNASQFHPGMPASMPPRCAACAMPSSRSTIPGYNIAACSDAHSMVIGPHREEQQQQPHFGILEPAWQTPATRPNHARGCAHDRAAEKIGPKRGGQRLENPPDDTAARYNTIRNCFWPSSFLNCAAEQINQPALPARCQKLACMNLKREQLPHEAVSQALSAQRK